jgi:CheY-like chemotaxis protein
MGLKLMFVDDEPAVLKLCKVLVEPMGFEVVTVEDSQEAARRIMDEKFDGIFVDARMPQPDGFEMTKLVRTSPSNSNIPVVMLTGRDDPETMRKGFEAGITFFLGKPLTQSRLALILRTIQGAIGKEKRRYARLPLNTIVMCQAGRKIFKSEGLDISEGGMLLGKGNGAKIGQEFDLEFTLPQSPNPLKPRARVTRRQTPNQLATQFVSLKASEREIIKLYIEENCKDR